MNQPNEQQKTRRELFASVIRYATLGGITLVGRNGPPRRKNLPADYYLRPVCETRRMHVARGRCRQGYSEPPGLSRRSADPAGINPAAPL